MNSIGVYKTDVDEPTHASKILDELVLRLPDCYSTFDLEDCDNVLRVESFNGEIDDLKIRDVVESSGHHIEKLPF